MTTYGDALAYGAIWLLVVGAVATVVVVACAVVAVWRGVCWLACRVGRLFYCPAPACVVEVEAEAGRLMLGRLRVDGHLPERGQL